MQTDAPCRVLHVVLDPFAGMACVVVHGQVQFFVTAVGPAQLFEQFDEQLAVLSLSRHPMEAPRLEVERPADPHLAVRPRGPKRSLLALAHPAEADPGVGLKPALVLEEGARLLDHRKDIRKPRPLSLFVLFGALLGPDRTRPPPAEAQAMERAANRLSAYPRVARSLNSSTAKSLQLQRDRSHPWEVGDSSSTKRSTYSSVDLPSNGLGPRRARSSKAPIRLPPRRSARGGRRRWSWSSRGPGRSGWERSRLRRAGLCASAACGWVSFGASSRG